MSKGEDFGRALRLARRARGLTQEDFSITSSRTYISMLERHERSPTLAKVGELAETLEMHPLSLLALTWLTTDGGPAELRKLLSQVEAQVNTVLQSADR